MSGAISLWPLITSCQFYRHLSNLFIYAVMGVLTFSCIFRLFFTLPSLEAMADGFQHLFPDTNSPGVFLSINTSSPSSAAWEAERQIV